MTDPKQFAVCVKNDGYEVSLELRKLYEVLDDPFADQHGMIRVVDESGEDYLFAQKYFVPVDLPDALASTLLELVHSG
jgi:hypothetical protein